MVPPTALDAASVRKACDAALGECGAMFAGAISSARSDVSSSDGLSRLWGPAKVCVERSPRTFGLTCLHAISQEQSDAVASAQAACARLQLVLGPMTQIHLIVNNLDCMEESEPSSGLQSGRAPPIILFSPSLQVSNRGRSRVGICSVQNANTKLSTDEVEVSADTPWSRVTKLQSFISATVDMAAFLAASLVSPQLYSCSAVPHFERQTSENLVEGLTGRLPTWYTSQVLHGPAIASSMSDTGLEANVIPTQRLLLERSLWTASDAQLQSVYEQVFRLVRQKAGSKGPLRYGEFSAPFLTLRVALVSTSDRRADELSPARVTLINLMVGDSTATHLAVRSPTAVRKRCTRVDGNNVLRGVLALFAKEEILFSQPLHMVLAKLPRRPMESVVHGGLLVARGKGKVWDNSLYSITGLLLTTVWLPLFCPSAFFQAA
jgi:hypothetical protein